MRLISEHLIEISNDIVVCIMCVICVFGAYNIIMIDKLFILGQSLFSHMYSLSVPT
jgi:hypothetical protein